MADVTLSMPFLLLNEDGKNQRWFYQSPSEAVKGEDPGGETVHGIARAFWPGGPAGKSLIPSKEISGFPRCFLLWGIP